MRASCPTIYPARRQTRLAPGRPGSSTTRSSDVDDHDLGPPRSSGPRHPVDMARRTPLRILQSVLYHSSFAFLVRKWPYCLPHSCVSFGSSSPAGLPSSVPSAHAHRRSRLSMGTHQSSVVDGRPAEVEHRYSCRRLRSRREYRPRGGEENVELTMSPPPPSLSSCLYPSSSASDGYSTSGTPSRRFQDRTCPSKRQTSSPYVLLVSSSAPSDLGPPPRRLTLSLLTPHLLSPCP